MFFNLVLWRAKQKKFFLSVSGKNYLDFSRFHKTYLKFPWEMIMKTFDDRCWPVRWPA